MKEKEKVKKRGRNGLRREIEEDRREKDKGGRKREERKNGGKNGRKMRRKGKRGKKGEEQRVKGRGRK